MDIIHPYLIGIAGPSGAGKSSFCKYLTSNFQGVSRLKLDDFFKDIQDIPKAGEWINWDIPENLKWPELIQSVKNLHNGKYAIVPNYDRKSDKCIGEKCVFSSPIILIDGFMTLHNPELRKLLDLSIFFDLSTKSQITRRKERQPWVEDGYLYEVMLPAAKKYILPSAKFADFIINAELSKQEVNTQCITIIEHRLSDKFRKINKNNKPS